MENGRFTKEERKYLDSLAAEAERRGALDLASTVPAAGLAA